MIFSVSNNGFEWSLDFEPNSVTLTVDDLVEEKKISSQENPQTAWCLLLSQRGNFLKNDLREFQVPAGTNGKKN